MTWIAEREMCVPDSKINVKLTFPKGHVDGVSKDFGAIVFRIIDEQIQSCGGGNIRGIRNGG